MRLYKDKLANWQRVTGSCQLAEQIRDLYELASLAQLARQLADSARLVRMKAINGWPVFYYSSNYNKNCCFCWLPHTIGC